MNSTLGGSRLVLLRLLSAPCPLCILCVLCVSTALAQNYRCDWSVVDIGGGAMSSVSYKANASVGQTAVGQTSSTNFWQIDTGASAIREESHWSETEPLKTRLLAPAPNPCFGTTQIRYTLATESRVVLSLFDLTGRNRFTLVNSVQKPGRYALRLNPSSASPVTRLAPGAYFLRLRTRDRQDTQKVVIR